MVVVVVVVIVVVDRFVVVGQRPLHASVQARVARVADCAGTSAETE